MTGSATSTVVSRIRVGILEDEPLFRAMLTETLAHEHRIDVTRTAATVAEARAKFAGAIDLALLDVNLADGNGFSLGVQLRRAHPDLSIVLLSAHNVMDLLVALPPDVRERWSYLSKTSSTTPRTLIQTILRTAAGRTVLDPALLAQNEPRSGTAVARLTSRQYQVLRLISEGLSNPGIGERLNITEKSVQNHVNAIYSTLGISPNPEHNPRVLAALLLLEGTGPLDH